MSKEILYGVQKQQLKHLTANEYNTLKELCFLSKNIYNVALYNIRQYFFDEKKFLSYNNIVLIEHEESYTSKADFLANDSMPVYNDFDKKNYIFSGNRISRGQYKSATGAILNADINGSLNIMRKANVKNINLISKKYLNPKRFKIA